MPSLTELRCLTLIIIPYLTTFVITKHTPPSPNTKYFARKGDPSLCTEGAERAWTSAGATRGSGLVLAGWLPRELPVP